MKTGKCVMDAIIMLEAAGSFHHIRAISGFQVTGLIGEVVGFGLPVIGGQDNSIEALNFFLCTTFERRLCRIEKINPISFSGIPVIHYRF
jgi:hypothetical protein